MTTEDYADLQRLRAKYAAPSAPPPPQDSGMGMGGRVARHIGNLVPDAVGRAVNLITSVPRALMRSAGADMTWYPDVDWRPFSVPEPTTPVQAGADLLLSGIGPELPSLLFGGHYLKGAAGAAGLTGRTATVAADTTLGAVSGLRQSNKEGAFQAGEFGLTSVLTSAIPGGRPIMHAIGAGAANAGVAAVGQAARGHDITSPEALTQIGIMGALPGAQRVAGAVGKRLFSRAPKVAPSPTADTSGPRRLPEGWRAVREEPHGDGTFTTTFQTPSGHQQWRSAERFEIHATLLLNAPPPAPRRFNRAGRDITDTIDAEFTIERPPLGDRPPTMALPMAEGSGVQPGQFIMRRNPAPDVIYAEGRVLSPPTLALPGPPGRQPRRTYFDEPPIIESEATAAQTLGAPDIFPEPTIGMQSRAQRIAQEQDRIAAFTPEQRNALELVRPRRLFARQETESASLIFPVEQFRGDPRTPSPVAAMERTPASAAEAPANPVEMTPQQRAKSYEPHKGKKIEVEFEGEVIPVKDAHRALIESDRARNNLSLLADCLSRIGA